MFILGVFVLYFGPFLPASGYFGYFGVHICPFGSIMLWIGPVGSSFGLFWTHYFFCFAPLGQSSSKLTPFALGLFCSQDDVRHLSIQFWLEFGPFGRFFNLYIWGHFHHFGSIWVNCDVNFGQFRSISVYFARRLSLPFSRGFRSIFDLFAPIFGSI